jgi:hypothetical protein
VKNSNTAAHLSGHAALEARFAYRLAARLSEHAETLDADVSERLRFAREKAMERSRALRVEPARPVVGITSAGAAVLGGGSGWWVKLASVIPLVALAAGLLVIQHMHAEAQISTAAEIDADLLSDDLPPSAYSDDGFVEFLKTPRE